MAKPKNNIRVRITSELKGLTAFIRIVTYISEFTDANSVTIRELVDSYLQQGAITCKVYLNSKGGDVFESTEMANELSRFGQENVTIYGGAIIASAATYLTSKFHTICRPNTQIMIHKPSIYTEGNIDSLQSDVKLLQNTTQDYLQAYADKTGKTTAEIEAIWAKGDVWMTAAEALTEGFIDEVSDNSMPVEITAMLDDEDTLNQNKMDKKKLIAMLGLAADATDEQIEAALKKNKEDAEQAAALKADAAKTLKARAETLVNAAIAQKKIKAEAKERYVKLAEADYESTEQVLTDMVSIPKLSASIEKTGDADEEASRKDWTLDDYLDKDPAAYETMKESNPERAKKLEAAYFGSKVK